MVHPPKGATMTTIQHQFGQAAIDSIAAFCTADIKTVANYAAEEFSHVSNAQLRTALAKTMYGARWLYKLVLGLLVDGDKSIAHVRTQVLRARLISQREKAS